MSPSTISQTLLHHLTSSDAGWSFASLPFLATFIVFFIGYLLLEPSRHRRRLLAYTTAFSLFFAFKANGLMMLLLPTTTLLSWWLTRRMDAQDRRVRRRFLLTTNILLALLPLFYFKYSGLFISSVSAMMGDNLPLGKLFMPLGISFYTFQAISYTVDVYRKRFPATTPLLEYAFYLTFFPLLMAGPITRASVLIPQEHAAKLPPSGSLAYQGLWLILLGIVKKVIVADYIAQYNNWIFDSPADYSGFECLMGVIGFTVQIFCDFSGYSDMAIGLAALMGFQLHDNFRFPYQATSLTEFWHRWHISLSTWFRDYVYIPMGGNRKGEVRTYLNNLATMLVAGLWHGATGMFVCWGLLHGLGLVVNKFFHRHVFNQVPPSPFSKPLAWLTTFSFVAFAWIFFRAATPSTALQIIQRIASDCSLADLPAFFAARPLWTAFTLVALELHSIRECDYLWLRDRFVTMPWLLKLLLAVIIVQAAVNLSGASVQPFIYSRF